MAHNDRAPQHALSPTRRRLLAWAVSILLTLGVLTATVAPAQAATAVPSGLKVVAAGSTSLDVSWKAVPGAPRYRVAWSTSSSMSKPTYKRVTPAKLEPDRARVGPDLLRQGPGHLRRRREPQRVHQGRQGDHAEGLQRPERSGDEQRRHDERRAAVGQPGVRAGLPRPVGRQRRDVGGVVQAFQGDRRHDQRARPPDRVLVQGAGHRPRRRELEPLLGCGEGDDRRDVDLVADAVAHLGPAPGRQLQHQVLQLRRATTPTSGRGGTVAATSSATSGRRSSTSWGSRRPARPGCRRRRAARVRT